MSIFVNFNKWSNPTSWIKFFTHSSSRVSCLST